jgi:hypothetical protein
MAEPDTYLIDRFIDFAEDEKVSLREAAERLVAYARQRQPEREVEIAKARSTHSLSRELSDRIWKSECIRIVARIVIRTRVRYFYWPYYPEFEVVAWPQEYWWCSIRYDEPNWPVGPFKDRIYLDDLFHDPYERKFWMREPYVEELPLCHTVFQHLADPQRDKLGNTLYSKVDPDLMRKFCAARAGSIDFESRECDSDRIYGSPPLGSAGWRDRASLLPQRTYNHNRFKQ